MRRRNTRIRQFTGSQARQPIVIDNFSDSKDDTTREFKLYDTAINQQETSPMPHTFTSSESIPTYSEIVTKFNLWATTYGGSYDVSGTSVQGRDIPCIRLLDDGIRPIIGVNIALHGNELEGVRGVLAFIDEVMTSSKPEIVLARNTFSFFVTAINPDGMVNSTRANANGVNLNRNFEYYWKASTATNKGAVPNSEPETQAFISWMTPYVSRVIFWCDCHDWLSQIDHGFLVDQIYKSSTAIQSQRATYLYAQSLLTKADYAGIPLSNGRPVLREARSNKTAYLRSWVAINSRPDAFALLVESPKAERIGTNSIVMMCILQGALLSSLDTLQATVSTKMRIDKLPLVNNNSNLRGWNSYYMRPSWFGGSKIRMTQGDGDKFINIVRPDETEFPHDISEAGYASNGTHGYVVAGKRNGATTNLCKVMSFSTGKITSLPAYPESVQNLACALTSNKLYAYGGWNPAGYSGNLYELDIANPAAWTLFKSTIGIQRHSMCVWGNNLVIVGGRDTIDYRTNVTLVNITTKAETLIASLPVGLGWLCTEIDGDNLLVFGGWDGAITYNTVSSVNLNSGVVTNKAPLPLAVARQGCASSSTNIFLCCGSHVPLLNAPEQIQSSVWSYDRALGTISTINYTLGSYIDEHGDTITMDAPDRTSPVCVFNPIDTVLSIVGGNDLTNSQTRTIYELDFDFEMSLRESLFTSWGFLRASSVFNCSLGETINLTCTLRNTTAFNQSREPYVRLMIVAATSSVKYYRKVRSYYIVPPRGEFTTLSLSTIIEPGEIQYRVYLRVYGGGTAIDLKSMVVKKTQYAGVDINEPSSGYGIPTKTFSPPLSPDNIGTYRILLTTSFGSKHTIDTEVINFDVLPHVHDGAGVSSLSVRYASVAPASSIVSTGDWVVRYVVDGSQFESTISAGELNHSRGSEVLTRGDKLELVLDVSAVDTKLHFYFYGTLNTVTIPYNSNIAGYTVGLGVATNDIPK